MLAQACRREQQEVVPFLVQQCRLRSISSDHKTTEQDEQKLILLPLHKVSYSFLEA